MAAQRALILFLCVSVLATGLQAADQPSTRPVTATFIDVALQPTGGVQGRFVDSNGEAIAGATATLHRGQMLVGTAQTQEDGTYSFPTVGPGVYRLDLDGQWQMVRVWEGALRPPAARDLLTVVRQETVVRGGERISDSLTGQIGLGIGVAGAIGAGVAIAESRDSQQEVDALRRMLKVTSP